MDGGKSVSVRKKRIAFVLNDKVPSFRNRMFMNSLKHMGHEVTVLIKELSGDDKDRAVRGEVQGMKLITLRVREGKDSAKRYAKLVKQTLRNIQAGTDIVYLTHMSQIKPFIFKKPKKLKFVYDATESSFPVPSIKSRPVAMVAGRVMEALERRFLKMAKVDVVTPSAARSGELGSFQKICAHCAVVRTVPAISQSASDGERLEAAKKIGKRRVVATIGGLSGPDELDYALAVADNVMDAYKDVLFMFFGKPYADKATLKQMLQKRHMDGNVFFLDLPYKKMMAYLENARVGLALDLGMGNGTTSQKSMSMFSYMQAALPVVGPAMCAGGTTAREAGCGMFVDTTSPVEVAGAVAYMLTNPAESKKLGLKGRKAFMSTHNWEAEKQKLAEVFTNSALT